MYFECMRNSQQVGIDNYRNAKNRRFAFGEYAIIGSRPLTPRGATNCRGGAKSLETGNSTES